MPVGLTFVSMTLLLLLVCALLTPHPYARCISLGLACFIGSTHIQQFESSELACVYFTGLSGWLVMLTLGLTFLILYASSVSLNSLDSQLIILSGVALTTLFLVKNILLFYFLFEFSLIPIVMIVLGYGSQPERVFSGVMMFMYTVSASLPFLWWVITYAPSVWDDSMPYLPFWQSWLLLPFLMKLPMFYLHFWLPQAHVEAPEHGSMLLAGVLLKLGGYGLYRIVPHSSTMNFIFVAVSLTGGLYACVVSISQIDIKSLIAYSSIVHMAIIVPVMLTPSGLTGVTSAMIMVAHGIASSGLFYSSTISYSNLGTRSLMLSSGLNTIIPGVALLWGVNLIMNLGIPPSVNLLGEYFAVFNVFLSSNTLISWVSATLLLSMMYNISCYINHFHGWSSSVFNSHESIKHLSLTAAHAHWLVLGPVIYLFFI